MIDSSPINLHRKIVELIDAGVPFAVALILSAEGSTPQRAGVKAVVEASGRLWGTVGGGVVEAEALRAAIESCRLRQARVLDVHLHNDDAAGTGAICGGSMRILVDPTAAKHRACYAQAAEAFEQRRRGVLLTTIGPAATTEVSVEWLPEEAIPARTRFPGSEALQSCLVHERSQRVVQEAAASPAAVEVFIEAVVPCPLLLIAGGGHVGQALSGLAAATGFDVVVIDDRPEFTDPALFPQGVRTRCGPAPEQLAAFPLDADTYIVLVTRGHRHDAEALAACIHQPVAYLGMIGSRRKVALLRESFLESGTASAAEFDRVFAPIGLPIGAVTVPEIAVSIMAQLIAVRRGTHSVPAGRETLR